MSDFTITNQNDLQGANVFCDPFLHHDYDIQNFRYSQDFDITGIQNSLNIIKTIKILTIRKILTIIHTTNFFEIFITNIMEFRKHVTSFKTSVLSSPTFNLHIFKTTICKTLMILNVQFFHNGFDNYQEQDVQEQDVQASRDYLLDVLPLGNNGEEIYNNVADLFDVSDDEFQEDESDNNHLELVLGLSFPDWQSFKNWLNQFALQEGFDYKIRTSEKDENDENVIRRANYVCAKAGTHKSKKTADPNK